MTAQCSRVHCVWDIQSHRVVHKNARAPFGCGSCQTGRRKCWGKLPDCEEYSWALVRGYQHNRQLRYRIRKHKRFKRQKIYSKCNPQNDQAYYQRAIASQPQSTTKAFLLGGLSWFSIPFAFASCLGLSAVALSHGPNPLVRLTADEVSAGLPAPKAAAGMCLAIEYGSLPSNGADEDHSNVKLFWALLELRLCS